MLNMLIQRFDEDKNEELTKDELPDMLWQRLARADADEDGVLTKEELKKAHAERRSRRGRPDTGEEKPAE